MVLVSGRVRFVSQAVYAAYLEARQTGEGLPGPPLPARTQAVLERLGTRLTQKQVARQLGVSTRTVKRWVADLKGELGVQSQLELGMRVQANRSRSSPATHEDGRLT